jgi:hypothetical protein
MMNVVLKETGFSEWMMILYSVILFEEQVFLDQHSGYMLGAMPLLAKFPLLNYIHDHRFHRLP